MTAGTSDLDAGRPLLGTWVKLPAVEVVELMALAGLDFVVIDMEHAPMSLETAATLMTIASARGLRPLVRVADRSPAHLARVLDVGAGGLLIPHVDSASEAEAVVDAMRFPPRGHRGSGRMSRAGGWGATSRDAYMAQGDAVWCIPQIESRDAAAEIAAILSVDGVDGVFLGAGDLSQSMGLTPSAPEVVAVLDEVRSACRAADTPWGEASRDGAAAGRSIDAGASFVTLSNDTSVLLTTMAGMVADATGATP